MPFFTAFRLLWLILWVPVWLPIPSISQSYISFITHAAVYIAMPIAGLPDVNITTGGGFHGISPFIALLLATPDIRWLRKLKLIITGSLLLLAFHLIIVVLQIVFPSHQTGLFAFYAIFGRIALPLILWVTMSRDVLHANGVVKLLGAGVVSTLLLIRVSRLLLRV